MTGIRTHIRHKSERGLTIPMLALLLVALFTMAALAVDLGVMYTARTSMQHVADAAALAGAYTFLDACTDPATRSSACQPSTPLQPAAAEQAAIAAADTNKILGVQVNSANTDLTVNVDQANRRVIVTVTRQGSKGFGTYFARVAGRNSVNVSARAAAEAGTNAVGTHCLKPLLLANTSMSTEDPKIACASQIIFDPNTKELTDWAKSQFGTTKITLRPVGPCSTDVPSQYQSLDFGSGANTFNCTLSKCLNQCKNVDKTVLSCGDTFSTQNGNDPNKTLDGINDLIGDPPDVFVSPGKYQDGSNPSLIKTDSRSVATAAVWDSCSNPIDPGKEQKIQILGFVDIFVGGAEQSPCAKTGSNDAVVTGYLVSAGSCASAGGGGGAPAGAAGGVPIRLVQVPQS